MNIDRPNIGENKIYLIQYNIDKSNNNNNDINNYILYTRQHCQLLVYNLYIELSKKNIKIKVIILLLI